MTRIAIVGMACRYPDAESPARLWENVLAGRRAFRQLPDQRMRLADYWSADPAAPDRFYARMAAVLTDWEFDRIGFKVAGSTYRSTDLTHWLALDVAAKALEDAGFPAGSGLPRDRTTVVVGNTLTGEFTRANTLRLRWPYVRRVMAAALHDEGWDDERLSRFLADTEKTYKAPFPAVDEDTLAGGLSNTIAGRICNHFDLHGGGYTVDGACSSSLLSVITACRSLAEGDVSVAIAGGVDLSIDPFEMVGFAKTGALARREMLVYDRGANGFWPGEGCGLVVLMRETDALTAGHRIYATLAGWGVSSDGRGGITRPEVDGHRLALTRAYRRAGFGLGTVPLFEGHGTGTEVGDATELRALSLARRADDAAADPAAISSIKSMIGHTKAAAGVAGLIKATLAVHHGVITPAVGMRDPHPELTGDDPALRVVRQAEPWPAGAERRAGVTALGFGGINTHVVLDAAPGTTGVRHRSIHRFARSAQDAELLLIDAGSADELRDRATALGRVVALMSYAELGDLAPVLQRDLAGRPYRAAVVATSPGAAGKAFTHLAEALTAGRTSVCDPVRGAFAGHVTRSARIGFLFPGQGSGHGAGGGAIRRRFAVADAVYHAVQLPADGDPRATEVAQPRVVTGSMAALRVLTGLGVDATVALGHSLGELTALHWANGLSDAGLLDLATARGAIMAGSPGGAMLGVAAGPDVVAGLIAGEPVVVAGYNGPRQTVVAGPPEAVDRVAAAVSAASLVSGRLTVAHAFHSPLMAASADRFRTWLSGRDAGAGAPKPFEHRLGPVSGRVVSTVTGAVLDPDCDLRELLYRQITDPVRFSDAVSVAASEVDLFLEVGPGRVLTRMVQDITDVPVLPVDSEDPSLAGLLGALGAAWVAGAPLAHESLFASRPNRPIDPWTPPSVLASPCEAAPEILVGADAVAAAEVVDAPARTGDGTVGEVLEVLLRLAAERAELPSEVVDPDAGLLDHLHLSSITVGQLVNQAARELGLPGAQSPVNFATATVRQLAEALHEMAAQHDGDPAAAPVAGAGPWVRAFATDWARAPLPGPAAAAAKGGPWQAFGAAGPHTATLQAAGLGPGVLLVVPAAPGPADLTVALTAVQAAVLQPAGSRLVVLQHGRGVTALAKTARLEAPGLVTTVISGPVTDLAAEVAATTDFTEVRYDEDGTRRVPALTAVPYPAGERAELPLGPADVLLVTGGGKGITAECALSLAELSGARLALLGRSDPATDTELAGNLDRMAARGVEVRYLRADVTVRAEVEAAVAAAEQGWGPVTAVLHGAGRNQPTALTGLDPELLSGTLAPKLDGLRAVMDAVDPARLRLLVTFGSIIGRAGLRGEGHYALANDWLAGLTAEYGRELPGCRTVCLEWSVWSGTGMGERLSVVETLERAGIVPITPEYGIRALRAALADPDMPPSVVICGRADGLETVRFAGAELPLLRFVAQPVVHYPGVELVTEVVLSGGDDPYLEDHDLDGSLLMPAVLGMEAMVQVATALTGRETLPAFEDVRFARPIVVARGASLTVRVAALVTGPDTVDMTIRTEETGYAADHFRATLTWAPPSPATGAPPQRVVPDDLPPIALDPGRELYGGIMFQGKRFQRLLRYRRITARDVEYDVAGGADAAWFSPFLPGRLLLADPGVRDTVLHGIQVCVPDTVLLPAGVERIEPAGPGVSALDEVYCVAAERAQDGDTFVYDVAVRDRAGTVVERWIGLRLHAVHGRGTGDWPAALLGPLLHRPLAGHVGRDVAIAVESHRAPGAVRTTVTDTALSRLLGRAVRVRHRPDGKPEPDDEKARVSVAHADGLTLVVAAEDGVTGCDVERVAARSARDWDGLLGARTSLARLVAGQLQEPFDVAATRIWAALECLQKAGRVAGPTLSAEPADAGPWQVLTDGRWRIATVRVRLREQEMPMVIAVLAGDEGN